MRVISMRVCACMCVCERVMQAITVKRRKNCSKLVRQRAAVRVRLCNNITGWRTRGRKREDQGERKDSDSEIRKTVKTDKEADVLLVWGKFLSKERSSGCLTALFRDKVASVGDSGTESASRCLLNLTQMGSKTWFLLSKAQHEAWWQVEGWR